MHSFTIHIALGIVALASFARAGNFWPNLNDPCSLNPLTCNNQNPIQNIPITFKRALVIAAHPDDIEQTSGGTVAKWIQEGTEVRYILLTNGDKGTRNRSMTTQELATIRRQEQLNAASVLGVTSVDFFDIGDGELQNTVDVREKVVRLIRTYRPEVIATWNPSERFENYQIGYEHSDHRAAGAVTLQCVYPTANDFLYFPDQIFDDGLDTWGVPQIYLFSFNYNVNNPNSNIAVDISSTLDVKIKALLQHKSQISDPVALSNFVRNQASLLGNPANYQYAEWFTRVLTSYYHPNNTQSVVLK
jgi:LmbE family N-acetylglucosaminyl deacetylase